MRRADQNDRVTRRATMRTAALLSAGLLGSTAGCIGPDDDDEPTDDDAGDDPGDGTATDQQEMADQVDIWGWDVAARSLMLTADEYEANHDATVAVEEFGRVSMKEELMSNLNSGSGAPPIGMLESVDGPAWVQSTGAIRDLSSRIEEAGLREAFVSGKWEALDIDDGTYALPWDIGPTGVFYRRSIYEEHGIDPGSIETWEDFREEGRKLPDDVHMLNLPTNDLDGVWRFQCRQLEMQPITEAGEINIHSDTSLRVARNINELHDAGVASTLDGWTAAWFTAYSDGDVASLPSAAWMEGTIRSEMGGTAGDWGVYKIPAYDPGGNRASNWGGSNLMITTQASDAEAERAWDYMTWSLAREDMQLLMFQEYGIFPALESTYEDPAFDEELDFFGGQDVRNLFAEVAVDLPGWRFTEVTPDISAAINANLGRMLDDELTPEEAVQQAAETVADETGREMA